MMMMMIMMILSGTDKRMALRTLVPSAFYHAHPKYHMRKIYNLPQATRGFSYEFQGVLDLLEDRRGTRCSNIQPHHHNRNDNNAKTHPHPHHLHTIIDENHGLQTSASCIKTIAKMTHEHVEHVHVHREDKTNDCVATVDMKEENDDNGDKDRSSSASLSSAAIVAPSEAQHGIPVAMAMYPVGAVVLVMLQRSHRCRREKTHPAKIITAHVTKEAATFDVAFLPVRTKGDISWKYLHIYTYIYKKVNASQHAHA
jgi:hypothetical protein